MKNVINLQPPTDWKLVRFGDATTDTTLGVTARGINGASHTLPLLKMGNLTWGNLSLSNVEHVDLKSVPDALLLRRGDLLFNTRNTLDLVGKTAVWHNEELLATFDNNLLRVRFNKNINPDFVCIQMTTGDGKKRLHSLAAGSTSVAAIYWKDLSKFFLFMPEKPVQDEIVRIISVWNRAIDSIERLTVAKQKRRAWLMQQLLTDKQRAPGLSRNWTMRRMKELVEPIQRPVLKPTDAYKALGIRSHCKGTFTRLVNDPSTVDMDQLYVAKTGDLIVNITFAWEGAIAFVPKEHDGNLVSHRFPTYRLKDDVVDPNFLRYVVTQQRFVFTLGLISPGGAGRNRVMSKRDFLDIEVSVPCLEEQQKIGSILKLIDEEITLLSQQLDALREQKKGLLQQLLTGKRRVKISQNELTKERTL